MWQPLNKTLNAGNIGLFNAALNPVTLGATKSARPQGLGQFA